MNISVTSKQEILISALNLTRSIGSAKLNMRALAKYCGISVGSIYNYFPTKTDLMIAVVSQVWQEIFNPFLSGQPKPDFLALVEQIAASIQTGTETYPGFFTEHAAVITDKDKGKTAMETYFSHIEQLLLKLLLSDPNIRPDIWDDIFTPERFAVFVFDFLRTDLITGESRSDFLRELILHAVYKRP